MALLRVKLEGIDIPHVEKIEQKKGISTKVPTTSSDGITRYGIDISASHTELMIPVDTKNRDLIRTMDRFAQRQLTRNGEGTITGSLLDSDDVQNPVNFTGGIVENIPSQTDQDTVTYKLFFNPYYR